MEQKIAEDYISDDIFKLLRGTSFQHDIIGVVAITQALVLKWLRIKHKINIEIIISSSQPSWLARIVNNYTITHKGSGNFDYFTNQKQLDNEFRSWNTPEEATEAAIIYTLQNLIK